MQEQGVGKASRPYQSYDADLSVVQGLAPAEIPARGDLYFQPHARWIYQLPRTWTQVLTRMPCSAPVGLVTLRISMSIPRPEPL